MKKILIFIILLPLFSMAQVERVNHSVEAVTSAQLSDTASAILAAIVETVFDSILMTNPYGDVISVKLDTGNNFVTTTIIEVPSLKLVFTDIANTPVADSSDVSDWNTFFGLPANGTPFTAVALSGDTVKLYGGSNIVLKSDLFRNNKYLTAVIDYEGYITGMAPGGDEVFNANGQLTKVIMYGLTNTTLDAFYYCDSLTMAVFPALITIYEQSFLNCKRLDSIYFPNAITIGDRAFQDIDSLRTAYFPKVTTIEDDCFSKTTSGKIYPNTFDFPLLTSIGYSNFTYIEAPNLTFSFPSLSVKFGETVGNEWNLSSIVGRTVTLTVKHEIMTCDSGNPDGDIVDLQTDNTVTIVYSD